nr:reverse transcriptase domain-containing protein [Tanacetum cinerariifolium]
LGGSLSSHIRAYPSNEKGNSKSLIVVLETSGCLNVEVTLLKKRRWLCGSCLPVNCACNIWAIVRLSAISTIVRNSGSTTFVVCFLERRGIVETTYLRNEITNFLQKPNETFNEAWERFKDLLRQCAHHGFLELHQLDTFYNALNPNDQDALDSEAGGNFLDKIPRECLSIIESKSKVIYSRSRVTDVRENTNAPPLSSSPSNSFDLQQIAASLEDKLDIRINRFEKSFNDMKNSFVTLTVPLKAVEENLYNNKPSSSSSLSINTIPNPKGEAKELTTRSGMTYKEPPIPPPGVEQQEPTEETTDTKLPSTKDIQPLLVQVQVQKDKPVEEPSVVLFKKLLNNKNKLIELTKTPLNENCSAVVLKKLQEKLGDPGRFLIPCDFSEFDNCLCNTPKLGRSEILSPGHVTS